VQIVRRKQLPRIICVSVKRGWNGDGPKRLGLDLLREAVFLHHLLTSS